MGDTGARIAVAWNKQLLRPFGVIMSVVLHRPPHQPLKTPTYPYLWPKKISKIQTSSGRVFSGYDYLAIMSTVSETETLRRVKRCTMAEVVMTVT